MTITTIYISGKQIWLSIDQLRIYNPDNVTIELKDEFLCFFKLSEPTPLILGELFRDNNNRPMVFSSISEATMYAQEELTRRLQ